MKFDSLEEKCRYYQSLTDIKLMPNSYVICHLDGERFSKTIKNEFQKPFSEDFMNIMNETAGYLCKSIQGCVLAYVQSDEITLVLTDFNNEGIADGYFGYRLCKIQSICASKASGKFNNRMLVYKLSQTQDSALQTDIILNSPLYDFDCKVWSVPFYEDVFDWILYRQVDCVKNSKQQAAQTYCTYDELLHKTADEQIEFLKKKQNIDWNTYYSEAMKYGRFLYRTAVKQKAIRDEKEIEYTRNCWCILSNNNNLLVTEARENFLTSVFPNTRKTAELC